MDVMLGVVAGAVVNATAHLGNGREGVGRRRLGRTSGCTGRGAPDVVRFISRSLRRAGEPGRSASARGRAGAWRERTVQVAMEIVGGASRRPRRQRRQDGRAGAAALRAARARSLRY